MGMAPALALVLGAGLYAISFPPFDVATLGWIALVPLLVVIRHRDPRGAFAFGLLYGAACAWAVGPWMAPALSRFFGLNRPLGVLAASAYACMFWGSTFAVFAAGTIILRQRVSAAAHQIAVPALWVAMELVRARFLGQPWALLGYSQYAHPGIVQIAALTGVYGVSFLLASASTAVAEGIALLRASRVRACS
jgi:apolipoprotein N-acyltransferase